MEFWDGKPLATAVAAKAMDLNPVINSFDFLV